MTISKQHRDHILIAILVVLLIGVALTAGFFIMRSFTPEPDPEPIEPTLAIPGDQPPYHFDYFWAQNPYIAHAMGGIFGDTYTNSYEAFLLNYSLGHRIFEVDFYLTEDQETVSTHYAENWHNNTKTNEDVAFTADNFSSYLSEGKYHPLTYKQVIDIMSEYPDIYVVTDSKFTDREQSDYEFNQIISYAQSVNPTVLDRIIVQIYHPEMLDWVMDLYPWRSVIYTLYADPNWTPESVLEFTQSSGVEFITVWDGLVTPESGPYLDTHVANLEFTTNQDGILVPNFITDWKAAGLQLAAHTTNNLSSDRSLRSMGFDVIYTDFLLP